MKVISHIADEVMKIIRVNGSLCSVACISDATGVLIERVMLQLRYYTSMYDPHHGFGS